MQRPLRAVVIGWVGWALTAAAAVAAYPNRDPNRDPNPAPPGLSLERVTVTPSPVRGATLCRLEVAVRNGTPHELSAFRFRVSVEGRSLPGQERRVVLEPLAAGGERIIRLLNFWSAESERPAPADGTLDVEVELVEARRLERARAGGEEVMTVGALVPGLPVKAVTRVPYKPSTP